MLHDCELSQSQRNTHYQKGVKWAQQGGKPQLVNEFWSVWAAKGYFDYKTNTSTERVISTAPRMRTLIRALKYCREVFKGYADQHYAKGTRESAVKGQANDEHVAYINAALEGNV